MTQKQIKLSGKHKVALITTDTCEGITQSTAIIFVGFDTSAETALRSKTFKSEKAATKWAMQFADKS